MSTRCSHVTWFRSWLLNTHHTRVGFSHRSQYRLTVISSFMPFIWKAPSPMNAITAFSGCANFAAIEYGAAGPIVASVPESEDRIPARSFTWRAHQFVEDPESAVRMHPSGSRWDSSWATSCGFMGSPGSLARSSHTRHHSSTSFSIFSRQARSSLRSSFGISSFRVSFASPTSIASIGYRIPMFRPSISIWTPLAWPSFGSHSA